MKKPLKNMERPGIKHLFSQDSTSPGLISKPGVRKKNSLKTLDVKDLESPASKKPNQRTASLSTPRSSSRASKSLKDLDASEMQFLVSHDTDGRKSSRSSSHVRLHIALLLIGLLGSIACLWAMIYTSHSEEVAVNLGLERVANSLENILSLLAFPVLLFMVILTAYAIQQLYLAYRRANYLDSSHRPKRR